MPLLWSIFGYLGVELGRLRPCFWWMLLLVMCPFPVSGLCSTCLEERCYDNGECITGCAPGYVGRYCEEGCPSRCLNNECYIDRIKGTVTCIDGCEPGYCGAKCSYKCPGDCVTCDRQCGSCNVTLCPKRHYGADCNNDCSPRYEKCDRETGQCIRCRRGYYGDECVKGCVACFTRARDIADNCLSGCDKCKTQETCAAGFYGERCEHRCSETCQQSDDDSKPSCNRATGECSAGCVAGYHGLACNYTCSGHCLSGRCNRATGECSAGCASGYHGLTCNLRCDRFCMFRICNLHSGTCTYGCIDGYQQKSDTCEKLQDTERKPGEEVILALLICLIVIIVGFGVIALCLYLRRRT